MESENGSGNDKHRKINDGDHSDQDQSLSHSNSSASSISTSSLDSNPLESDDDVNASISLEKSENDDYKSTPAEWSMMSLSPRSAYSHTEFSTYSSATLPPPPQVMGRPPEYPGFDPNRIPASVFATNNKPASGMEWSVASNESLFSIQMGNMSFTRDHFNWMKSGELKSPDSEFANIPPGLPPITETPSNHSYGLPVVNEVELDNERKSTSSWGRQSIETEANKTNKETSTTADRIRLSDRSSNASDGHGMHPALEPPTPARVSQQSDGSRMSTSSFAFPVFGGETPAKTPVQKPQAQPEAPEEPENPAKTGWFPCSCSYSCCWWPFPLSCCR
ncbi:hypothetical protein AG4045_001715 [Apium graveolens]|uniref:Uncharacterized protein n=2 Tax=Apium graveolens TaxID=4045 RepID=A0A6L5BAP4_APIGR|nr:hypothetical protein AG4045_001715 [Apium graveolens]